MRNRCRLYRLSLDARYLDEYEYSPSTSPPHPSFGRSFCLVWSFPSPNRSPKRSGLIRDSVSLLRDRSLTFGRSFKSYLLFLLPEQFTRSRTCLAFRRRQKPQLPNKASTSASLSTEVLISAEASVCIWTSLASDFLCMTSSVLPAQPDERVEIHQTKICNSPILFSKTS